MSTLIVAFPKLEEAKAVRNLLIHRGFDVAVPCTSGAQAINQADTLSDGIISCQIIWFILNYMNISQRALRCC